MTGSVHFASSKVPSAGNESGCRVCAEEQVSSQSRSAWVDVHSITVGLKRYGDVNVAELGPRYESQMTPMAQEKEDSQELGAQLVWSLWSGVVAAPFSLSDVETAERLELNELKLRPEQEPSSSSQPSAPSKPAQSKTKIKAVKRLVIAGQLLVLVGGWSS